MEIAASGDRGDRTEQTNDTRMESAKGKAQGCASTGKLEVKGTK